MRHAAAVAALTSETFFVAQIIKILQKVAKLETTFVGSEILAGMEGS